MNEDVPGAMLGDENTMKLTLPSRNLRVQWRRKTCKQLITIQCVKGYTRGSSKVLFERREALIG